MGSTTTGSPKANKRFVYTKAKNWLSTKTEKLFIHAGYGCNITVDTVKTLKVVFLLKDSLMLYSVNICIIGLLSTLNF